MFDYDLVHELENTSKWRYFRIQYWLARIDWYRAERSARTQPSTPWRENPLFKDLYYDEQPINNAFDKVFKDDDPIVDEIVDVSMKELYLTSKDFDKDITGEKDNDDRDVEIGEQYITPDGRVVTIGEEE